MPASALGSPLVSAYVDCPHILEQTNHPCGVSESGKGRRTRIVVPIQYAADGDFIIQCPVCTNDIWVVAQIASDGEEDGPSPAGAIESIAS